MIFDLIAKLFGLKAVTPLKGRAGDQVRKKWNRIRFVSFIIFAIISCTTILYLESRILPIPSGISFDSNTSIFSVPEKNAIISSYERYLQEYGCPVNVKIGSVQIKPSGTIAGSQYEAIEESNKGFINLAKGISHYNIMLHALTHACVRDTIVIDEPFFVNDGSKVISYEGARFNVQLTNGEFTSFTQLEETIAEYLRKAIDPNFDINSPIYSLNEECIFKQLWTKPITNHELALLVQNSQLPDILGYLYEIRGLELNSQIANATFDLFSMTTQKDIVFTCDELKGKAIQIKNSLH